MSAIELFLTYPFLQRALLGALVVAVVSGVLGVFVVLRGLSLLGDGLAHLSFAGVAIGLASGFYPVPLAFLFAIGGALTIHFLRERGVVSGDTAIGILFTAGLALGVIVVSLSGGFNVDVNAYLFGSLLAIRPRDIAVVAGVGAALIVLLLLLYKELFYVTFSEESARVSGLPVGALNVVFMSLTAASIVITARIVGILLVSALIVIPAASALQFARSFKGALATSVAFGVASVLAGTLAAAEYGLATGGAIALASALLFVVAVLARFALARAGGSAA